MPEEHATRVYIILLEPYDAEVLARILKTEGKTCDQWLAERVREYRGEKKK